MSTEQELRQKLRKIAALFQGATTSGEQDAAAAAIERVRDCVLEHHGTSIDLIDSPILGMEGNHEYLLHAYFGDAPISL